MIFPGFATGLNNFKPASGITGALEAIRATSFFTASILAMKTS